MRPAAFGFFGIFVAMSSILGALLSKRLLTMLKAERMILLGTFITSVGALCFTGFALSGIKATVMDLVLMVSWIFIILLGIGMAIPNCLSLALIHYGDVLGTAGAIFGLGYYVVVSLITSGMSFLHDGSLVAMPLYFLGLAAVMVFVSGMLARQARSSS